ncbi:protein Tob1 [Platysternon megacephalum]|uniref:Protein Tob1 n=1 Tax=Platysternon megacephalum TaxID=55544 RepID=A0A4D9DPA0_9SAUR|nr:protein Tob1 [Platysternon megacephalum]
MKFPSKYTVFLHIPRSSNVAKCPPNPEFFNKFKSPEKSWTPHKSRQVFFPTMKEKNNLNSQKKSRNLTKTTSLYPESPSTEMVHVHKSRNVANFLRKARKKIIILGWKLLRNSAN